ncbi:tetratricopeptide repeat-containing protein [Babesia caballi]|uniref:Tetratricopeptide repeat-containing protein n=1 Tax=Babesia caballi TaxID=5871 RepID=A0AAV4LVG3_BABCB|nr:tetratricopeptide repeat-containing protein [Babesia caballi]
MATVGLDLGGFTSKVCVSWRGNDAIELHVNRVSNRETPTVVAYDKRIRVYGEEADLRSSSLHASSICLLPYIVGCSREDISTLIASRKYLFSVSFDESGSEPAFQVTFDDQPCSVQPRDVFAFFVNQLLATVRNQLKIVDPHDNSEILLSVSVPLYFSAAQHIAIHRSLAALGFGRISLYKQTECLLRRWCDSHLPDVYNDFVSSTQQTSMYVAFLDVGFCHCTLFVAEITKGDTFEHRIVAQESNDSVGTYQMIEKIADSVCADILSKKGDTVKVPSRQAFNVYKGCAKALKELSVVTEAKVDCERVLSDGDDFSMMVTRQLFEELCEPFKVRLNRIDVVDVRFQDILEKMMDRVLEPVPAGCLLAIEVIGGGSRVPFVKNLATDVATARNALQVVRMSMDSTSATASGAVCLAKAGCSPLLDTEDESCKLSEDDISAAKEREQRFSAVENEEFRKRSYLNQIDQYIIKTKGDARGNFSEHLKLEEVEPFLTALDEYALAAASDKTVTSDDCEAALVKCHEKVVAQCPAYAEALEAAEKARDAEMLRAATAADTSSVSEVNMDVTLPKATCLKRAAKNKDEGNALVSGGNIEMAAQHYVKVIQYCAKVTDPNDEERSQVDSLKLASNLNLAMCYIKMGTEVTYRKAVGCCTQALEISADNTKALYRRAVAYDKLNQLDDALSDARLGVSKFPENADLKQLLGALEKKVKLQEQRAKKSVLLKRDALYLRKVERLTRRLKVSLFFAHTASRARQSRAAADAGEAADARSHDSVASPDRVAESSADVDVEAVVRTARICQQQLEQLRSEPNLRLKEEGLKRTLTLLKSVPT